jgi:hypothetical protein
MPEIAVIAITKMKIIFKEKRIQDGGKMAAKSLSWLTYGAFSLSCLAWREVRRSRRAGPGNRFL